VIEKRDRQFFDGFMMLVGIFVGLIGGVLMLGDLVGDGEPAHAADDAGAAALIERIRPVGQVALSGDPALAAAPAVVVTTAAAAPAPQAQPSSGADIYEATCSLCHATGIGGAPMLSDNAAWAPRLAQAPDVLEDHVINGFQGSAGVMPAKGGRMDLSDADALAALQHMIEAASQ